MIVVGSILLSSPCLTDICCLKEMWFVSGFRQSEMLLCKMPVYLFLCQMGV